MAIVVKVVEHTLPNCCGFLSNSDKKFVESASFAVFHCSKVGESNQNGFVLQVFASKPPFEYLHLNRIFLQKLGLSVGDELMLEQVKDVNYCQWMEIKPETFEDWNIIENTSEVIEEDFLRQIRVVQEDLSFVLFLSSGISVNFRVVQIGSKLPKGSAALISNTTQVMVAPLSQPKVTEYAQKSTVTEAPHDNVALFNPLRFFIVHNNIQLYLRVMPHGFSKKLKVKLPISTVVTIGKGKYVKTKIYRVIRPYATSIYINLVELPEASIELQSQLASIHEALRQLPKGHCFVSSDLQQQGLQSSMRLLCIPANECEIRQLKRVLYSSSVNLKPHQLETIIKHNFKDQPYIPFIIPDSGCEITLKNHDGRFTVKFVSSEGIDSTKRCSLFLVDKLPTFQQSEHEIKIPPQPEQKLVPNFGEKQTKSDLFEAQSKIVDNILQYLKPVCQKPHCFSLKIDCNEFKGKSPDNVSLFLEQKLRLLEARWPSVLFLDQFDFLNNSLEDEERSKFIAKVYLKISSLIYDYNITVVATTKSQHSLADGALRCHGKRFFTLVMEITQISQS
ncbi:unnamed protein product [Bursaphelenchus okinawaensis]|uniref:Peroxisomal ATPase PEX1 N-terminal C-lobe domain-containing protein n=1 Tax=Bursaphelenchus okinawaensis TaxID=465554 RepID=A0A811LRQ0_9BILA|nr:unnamed protein product [Bursaphelenchus okinawaensis]CAG9126880.1 unnamed protein product [Bursaphelenchus okinawaensis]